MIEGLLKRAKREERTMRAITGVSIRQFNELIIFFEQALFHAANKKQKVRGIGGGCKGILRNVKAKFFFILFYLKVCLTYDSAGMFFKLIAEPAVSLGKNVFSYPRTCIVI